MGKPTDPLTQINPKPRQPAANLASTGLRMGDTRGPSKGGRKGKRKPKTQGPPFRPKTYAKPEGEL